jgi:hypothetical protein
LKRLLKRWFRELRPLRGSTPETKRGKELELLERSRGHGEDEGWYLLTNLGTLKEAVATFKCRSGIEAMFKDCKTGGYNIEKSHASTERLKTLILLIAFAYGCATLQGKKSKNWYSKICGSPHRS